MQTTPDPDEMVADLETHIHKSRNLQTTPTRRLTKVIARIDELITKGELDEAEKKLTKAKRRYGKRDELLILGNLLKSSRDLERKEQIKARLAEAEALAERGNLGDSIDTLDRALSLRTNASDNPEIFQWLEKAKQIREEYEARRLATTPGGLKDQPEAQSPTARTRALKPPDAGLSKLVSWPFNKVRAAWIAGLAATTVLLFVGYRSWLSDPDTVQPPAIDSVFVIDAAPWGLVERILRGDGKEIQLPENRVTPIVLQVAGGDYQITVIHPPSQRRLTDRIEVKASDRTVFRAHFKGLTANAYFRKAQSRVAQDKP